MTPTTMQILRDALVGDMQRQSTKIVRNVLVYSVVTALEKLIKYDREHEKHVVTIYPEEAGSGHWREREGGKAA